MFPHREGIFFADGGGGGGGGGRTAHDQLLEYGMICPVELDTWWGFRGYPFAVNFHLIGWGFNSGLSGRLHVGPVGQSPPIQIGMSDMVFVDLVNENKLEHIDSPEGS